MPCVFTAEKDGIPVGEPVISLSLSLTYTLALTYIFMNMHDHTHILLSKECRKYDFLDTFWLALHLSKGDSRLCAIR